MNDADRLRTTSGRFTDDSGAREALRLSVMNSSGAQPLIVAAMSYTFRIRCAAGAIRRALLTAVVLAAVALAPTARAQIHASASAVSELEIVLALVSFDRGSRTDIGIRSIPPAI